MNNDKVEQPVLLPIAEAADLATRAAAQGVPVPDYLGMHVLRSAYGALHPGAVALEQRAKLGQIGPAVEDGSEEGA
ncbi:hypothetical protein [Burkholderia gladioli]|uniref:hypothetical protein n=1 Tax=Burkholderia gladioli TaxID=28095 RepID=UPI00163FE1AC|nr:hypothetical protein [Burkholderia gladioli]